MKSGVCRIVCLIAVLLAASFLTGCPEKPEPVDTGPATPETCLEKLTTDQVPDFRDGLDTASLRRSLEQSLLYISRVPASRTFRFGPDTVDAARMRRSLETFAAFLNTTPSAEALAHFVRKNYIVYRAVGRDDQATVLFTGYFEPSVRGSRERRGTYQYPLFSVPDDLLTIDLSTFSDKFNGEPKLMARVDAGNQVVPYFTRNEINQDPEFWKKAAPIAWLTDRTDRFFLEIQGSGQVVLDDGGILKVHYHTKNGHPYRSIGKYLIDAGEITKEAMSMQAIRRWVEQHPDRMDEVFHVNPSVVFFKTEDGGPYGSLGVEVTPMRSIATDSSLFPKAALCYVTTALPEHDQHTDIDTWLPYSGFVLNQDTGGAIRGADRADFFFGNGSYAEVAAGHMKHPGNLYFLILKP